jgi:hypothetical protein
MADRGSPALHRHPSAELYRVARAVAGAPDDVPALAAEHGIAMLAS